MWGAGKQGRDCWDFGKMRKSRGGMKQSQSPRRRGATDPIFPLSALFVSTVNCWKSRDKSTFSFLITARSEKKEGEKAKCFKSEDFFTKIIDLHPFFFFGEKSEIKSDYSMLTLVILETPGSWKAAWFFEIFFCVIICFFFFLNWKQIVDLSRRKRLGKIYRWNIHTVYEFSNFNDWDEKKCREGSVMTSRRLLGSSNPDFELLLIFFLSVFSRSFEGKKIVFDFLKIFLGFLSKLNRNRKESYYFFFFFLSFRDWHCWDRLAFWIFRKIYWVINNYVMLVRMCFM